jgi:hypothetical protein
LAKLRRVALSSHAVLQVGQQHAIPETRLHLTRDALDRSQPAYQKSSKEIREALSDRGRGVRCMGERPPTRCATKGQVQRGGNCDHETDNDLSAIIA